MQVMYRPLCMGGSAEDRACVVVEQRKPAGSVTGMIFADLRRKIEIGREEGGAQPCESRSRANDQRWQAKDRS